MDKPSQRRKVTLAWNKEDAGRIAASLFTDEIPAKGLDVPISNYSSSNYDSVSLDGRLVGLSLFTGYSHNERLELSLGVIDPAIEVGTEVTLVWGEPDGGSLKASVERPHKQVAGPRHRLAGAVLGRGPRALRGGLAADRQGLSVSCSRR